MPNEDDIERCPLCDYPDVYLGATSLECGYDGTCANWTQKQADEVERLMGERHPTPESHTGPFQFNLDWGQDEEETPPWPIPDFTTD